MKQYLKMADVFPVEIRTDDESGSLICDGDGVILESFSGDKVADYALHAINSHDELVQMNQDLLAALEEGRRAIGEHSAPYDCYATGPITGDAFRDLVQCPACSFIAMYDDAIAKAKGGAA